MKIDRIQQIKEHRVFRNFQWPPGVQDFGRFNLIYGWNGSGKTTLSNLFRHLERREPITEGEVRFAVGGNIVDGRSLESAALPPVRVFNRDTVDRSVFEIPNQQLPPVYTFGEHGVEKQKQIEEKKVALSKATAELARWDGRRSTAENLYDVFCVDRAREIKNLLTVSGGGPYNNYDKSGYKAIARGLLDTSPPPAELSTDDRNRYLATKAAIPMPKVVPMSVPYPDFVGITTHVEELLAQSVQSRTIAELVADPELASWISVGLKLRSQDRAADKCHFCNQTLPAERIKHLEAHFNDEFRRFQVELDKATQGIAVAEKTIAELEHPTRQVLYSHLATEYGKQLESLSQQTHAVKMYFEALRAALSEKKTKPFTKLELRGLLTVASSSAKPPGILETIFNGIAAGLTNMQATVGQNAYKRVNDLIEQHNKYTDNFRERVGEARRALEQDEVVKSLREYKKRMETRNADTEKATETRVIVEGLQKEILQLEQDVRQHQKPAAELNREMAAYLGRDEFKFVVHQNGYAVTRSGQSAMNLSEGERTAIAFMYFLKSLSDTSFNIGDGVVVIDDPVSSLDTNSLYSAFGFMRARTAASGQLFVLTHNFGFFRQVKNWFQHLRGPDKKEGRFYMLTAQAQEVGGRDVRLETLDPLLKDYESEYHYLFKRVHDEASREDQSNTLASYYEMPNIARRLLEAFLAFRAPGVGNLYQQLDMLNVDAARKARVLRFLDTYSHHEQITDDGHDLSVLAEARAILREVLELIRANDLDHYQRMVALATQAPAT